jgi:four helix bundle protein
MKARPNAVQEKSYAFALGVVRLHRDIGAKEFVLFRQMLRAGTSIGANVEEALGGQSRRDFISKLSIARKEARECRYWLRLLRDSDLVSLDRASPLIAECDSLIRLLTSIILSAGKIAPPRSG